MQYRPEHTDLIDAIQEFLIKEVLPHVKDNDMVAYKTLVSWNMLGVVSRELKAGRPLLEQDAIRLAKLCGETIDPARMNDRQLGARAHDLRRIVAKLIRAEKSTPASEAWNSVKDMLKHNLQISNPRYGVD